MFITICLKCGMPSTPKHKDVHLENCPEVKKNSWIIYESEERKKEALSK